MQLRWQDIAERMGTVWHPLAQWSGIIADHRNPGWREPGWQYEEPRQGTLPLDQLATIAGILGHHTATPELCTAGLWEGYGGITGGSAYVVAFTRNGSIPKLPVPIPPAFSPEVLNGPRLQLPGRSYILFDCDARDFESESWIAESWGSRMGIDDQTPNLIWPADRSWLLASEIDFDSTLIGGTKALIADIVGRQDLEAVEIPETGSLAHDADLINPHSRDRNPGDRH